ncbi:hypothetical protein DPMN_027547 [Dreissena polymorpha]|uniref:Uncharacterized protein n=1 Tax=Dreissena polymorpha TaxID=45954 RepID=A0A9D4LVJ0_DREPO|nr:hypothetical protein DPMN_027547 [Dreissena polymorpha]
MNSPNRQPTRDSPGLISVAAFCLVLASSIALANTEGKEYINQRYHLYTHVQVTIVSSAPASNLADVPWTSGIIPLRMCLNNTH